MSNYLKGILLTAAGVLRLRDLCMNGPIKLVFELDLPFHMEKSVL